MADSKLEITRRKIRNGLRKEQVLLEKRSKDLVWQKLNNTKRKKKGITWQDIAWDLASTKYLDSYLKNTTMDLEHFKELYECSWYRDDRK